MNNKVQPVDDDDEEENKTEVEIKEECKVWTNNKYTDINLNFRCIAHFFFFLFGASCATGGVITYYATDYSEKTDLIWRVLKIFDPCVFWNHYPSNIISLLLVSLTVLVAIIYNKMLFFMVISVRNPLFAWTGASVLAVLCISESLFLNIFTVNLYPEGEKLDSGLPISNSQYLRVVLYVGFLLQWLIANLLNLVLHFKLLQKVGLLNKCRVIFIGIFTFIVCLGLLELSRYFFIKPKQHLTMFQKVITIVLDTLKPGWWFWTPFLFYRYLIPRKCGIKIRLSLTPNIDSVRHFAVEPEQTFSFAIFLYFISLLIAYIFNNPGSKKRTLPFPITNAFQSFPFAYGFMVIWVFICITTATGLILVYYRNELRDQKERGCCACFISCFRSLGGVISAIFWVSLYLCVLRVIPKYDPWGLSSLPVFLAVFYWIFWIYGLSLKTALFSILWLGSCAGCYFVTEMILILPFLLWSGVMLVKNEDRMRIQFQPYYYGNNPCCKIQQLSKKYQGGGGIQMSAMSKDPMFMVLVHCESKPENIEDFKQACIENASNSVKEPGVVRFDVLQVSGDENQNKFALLECYTKKDDVNAHKETDHYKKWKEDVEPWMAKPRTKQIFSNIWPSTNGWFWSGSC